MKMWRLFVCTVLVYGLGMVSATAQTNAGSIASRYATVEGVKLHYFEAGHGPTLLLLHGYAEDARMWKRPFRSLRRSLP
jgi:hypothetical protein